MWTEKYKPKRFEGIVGQKENIEKIREKVEGDGSTPPLLFHGPPGVGKTATAEVIREELDADWIEYNVSDYRGIDDMRDKILQTFRYAMVDERVVFLEEADMMTKQSQKLLRRPLETRNKKGLIIILCCNYKEDILDPIESRCKTYHFESVNANEIVKRLKYIAKREGIDRDINYEKIASEANGDVRKAIINMEDGDGDRDGNEYEELVQKYKDER